MSTTLTVTTTQDVGPIYPGAMVHALKNVSEFFPFSNDDVTIAIGVPTSLLQRKVILVKDGIKSEQDINQSQVKAIWSVSGGVHGVARGVKIQKTDRDEADTVIKTSSFRLTYHAPARPHELLEAILLLEAIDDNFEMDVNQVSDGTASSSIDGPTVTALAEIMQSDDVDLINY